MKIFQLQRIVTNPGFPGHTGGEKGELNVKKGTFREGYRSLSFYGNKKVGHGLATGEVVSAEPRQGR